MSSQLQIEANRRNAQHSTGPRTPEGKAVSRFNALKTGLSKEAPLGQVVARSYHQFHFLQRRIDSAERALYRALDHLRRLRETPGASQIAEPRSDSQPQPVENAP